MAHILLAIIIRFITTTKECCYQKTLALEGHLKVLCPDSSAELCSILGVAMKLNKELLLKLYRNLLRTRYYDELFTRLLAQGKLLGFYHQSLGQEAPGVGACSILHKDDIIVCENNGVAQFMPFEDTYPVKDIADPAHGYGMPGIVVDGQDVMAVAEAMGAAVERARQGKGPSLIECKTSRFCPHFVSTPDMFGSEMRAKEEIEELKKRDPIELFRQKLMARKILTEKDVERINNKAIAETDAAVKFADESPIPDPSILDELLYAN